VIDSRPDRGGTRYLRWRICVACKQVFETAEQATGRTMPLPTHPHDGEVRE